MTNSKLVNYLVNREVLRTPSLVEAFLTIDRSFFVPKKFIDEAYLDYSLPIGEGQTILQPSTVAIMLELLDAKEGDIVLEVGTGSGWVTALLSRLIGPQGYIYSYEINRLICETGKRNMSSFFMNNYKIQLGDAKKYWYDNAPYNRIIAGTTLSEDEIEELTDLLVADGALVFPTKDRDVKKITKDHVGNISQRTYSSFVFVPLQ